MLSEIQEKKGDERAAVLFEKLNRLINTRNKSPGLIDIFFEFNRARIFLIPLFFQRWNTAEKYQ